MTAATILNSLAAYLQPIIEAEKGIFEASGTVEDTLSKLQQAPGRWFPDLFGRMKFMLMTRRKD